jgi:hypothetical protein
MDELKARVQQSQTALQQLTQDNGRWLCEVSRCSSGGDCGGGNIFDVNSASASTNTTNGNNSSGWTSRPAAGYMCVDSSAGNESMLEVRERLIRADAQLQILAGLEKTTALVPRQMHARQLAKVGADGVVAQPMSSDE